MPIVDGVLISEEEINNPQGPSNWPKVRVVDYVIHKVSESVQLSGDSRWMTDTSTGRSMSYSQLLSSVDSFADTFRKKGLSPGNMVTIMASNFIEIPIIFLGAWKAGGCVSCLTLNLLTNHIKERIQDLQSKFVVTDELRLGRVLDAIQGLDFVQEVIVIGKEKEGCSSIDQFYLKENENSLSNLTIECPEIEGYDMESLVWLMYSSGTTGVPKGIVHTHRSLTRMLYGLTYNINLARQKFMFINLMMNAGGMLNALLMTTLGADIYCMSDCNDDNLLVAIDKVKPYGVSVFPNQIAWICRHPQLNNYDLSSVVTLMTGGSSMHPLYEREIFFKLPNLLVLNTCYGSSETGIVSNNRPKPHELVEFNKAKAIASISYNDEFTVNLNQLLYYSLYYQGHVFGSSGTVFPYCKVKVVDRVTGEKLGPGKEGELCVTSPYVMKEYLNKPEETDNLIRNGWCHLGDKGYYDDYGNIFVIGRYKELIKYRMAHVVPSNIEQQLMTHPAVQDAGVVGLPHDIDGELPLAFVVLRDEMTATAQELADYVKERVVDEETLRGGVRFIDKIPRNELGKVVRPRLLEML